MLKALETKRWRSLGEDHEPWGYDGSEIIKSVDYRMGKLFVVVDGETSSDSTTTYIVDMGDEKWRESKMCLGSLKENTWNMDISPDAKHMVIEYCGASGLIVVNMETMEQTNIRTDSNISDLLVTGNDFFCEYSTAGTVDKYSWDGKKIAMIYRNLAFNCIWGQVTSEGIWIGNHQHSKMELIDKDTFSLLEAHRLDHVTGGIKWLDAIVLKHYIVTFRAIQQFHMVHMVLVCRRTNANVGEIEYDYGHFNFQGLKPACRGHLLVHTDKDIRLIRLRQPYAICLLGGIRQKQSLLHRTKLRSRIFDSNALRQTMELSGVLLDLSVV